MSSIATAAILLQAVFVYFFTGLLKAKDPSWQNGLGVYYALALDTYARPLGAWLLQFREPVRALSYATLIFEIVGPLLLLATFRAPKLRMATVAAFVVFQAGLATCLSLGLFPWVSTAAMLPFLPRSFWEKSRGDFISAEGPGSDGLPVIARIFVSAVLVMVFLWNLGTIVPLPFRDSSLWAAPRFLALNQGWVMFMSPKVNDGWYVIPGRLADGSQVDLFSWREGVRWERPKTISARYKDLRWTKYMSSLWDYAALRPYFAWYLCDRWNRQSGEMRKLTKFEIDYQLELTRPETPNPPAEKVSLGAYLCGSELSF